MNSRPEPDNACGYVAEERRCPGDAPPLDDLPQGHRIGDYVIEKKLGSGGMATVYAVRSAKFALESRLFALKVFTCREGSCNELRRKFINEAEILHAEKLGHRLLVKVHDLQRSGNHPYYVMDLVLDRDGNVSSLDKVRCDQKRLCKWFGQVCEVLYFIHSRNLIHRDIKPSNVLIDANDDIRLTDFGVAKILDEELRSKLLNGRTMVTGMSRDTLPVFGTRDYLPPEVLDNTEATPAWDIWATGKMFFEKLTGGTCDYSSTERFIVDSLRAVDESGFWVAQLPKFLARDPSVRTPDLAVCSRKARDANTPKVDAHEIADVRKRIVEMLQKPAEISNDLFTVQEWAMNCGSDTDDPLIRKVIVRAALPICKSKFSSIKSRISSFVQSVGFLVNDANSLFSKYDTPPVKKEFDADAVARCHLDYDGDDWFDNIEYAFRILDNNLQFASSALELISEQLDLYESGHTGESAEENRRHRRLKMEEASRAENEARRVACFSDNGNAIRLKFVANKMPRPPFDHADTCLLASHCGMWFAQVGEKLWRTRNGIKWETVTLPLDLSRVECLKVVNRRLIAWAWEGGAVFSEDGNSWQPIKLPSLPNVNGCFCGRYLDFAAIGKRWVVVVERRRRYSYASAGILGMFCKTQESTVNETVYYFASSLDGEWTAAPDRLGLNEGERTEQNGLMGYNGDIVAITSCDSLFNENNHLSRNSRFVFTNSGGRLHNASCAHGINMSGREYLEPKMCAWSKGLICITNNGIFFSCDGRAWEKCCEETSCLNGFEFNGMFVLWRRFASLLVTIDGKSFKDVFTGVNAGHMANNSGKILAIDTDARTGGIYMISVE